MLKKICTAASTLALLTSIHGGLAQNQTKPGREDQPFTLSMAVNEVKVAFHASDSKGVPLKNLKREDVELFDNGKRQNRIVAFHEYRDLPIHVGFLLDYSPSMGRELGKSQTIAKELTKKFFRAESDRAFTMGFGVNTSLTQNWTGDADAVSKGINAAILKQMSGPDGTAMFDAIYKACKENFSHDTTPTSGNFILLFTDGEDTSSHVWEPETVDMCQRARTAIYVFTPPPKTMEVPRGKQILDDLVAQTGGRVFYENKQSVHDGLAVAVADMRYQYELVYAPARLKRDGSFHKIRLRCKVEGSQVHARSGYYANAEPGGQK